MSDRPDKSDRSSPEKNPLGLGARDPESSNTGSVADTSYDAQGSDPYTTGEPKKHFDDTAEDATFSNPDVPGSDEP
jgi:hypothetical protein